MKKELTEFEKLVKILNLDLLVEEEDRLNKLLTDKMEKENL